MTENEGKADRAAAVYIVGKQFANRIFVGGIPLEASAKDLVNFFRKFGRVLEARIVVDKYSGVSKEFGFVTFYTKYEALDAIKQGRVQFMGRILNLGRAIKKQKPSEPGEPVVVVQSPHYYAEPVLEAVYESAIQSATPPCILNQQCGPIWPPPPMPPVVMGCERYVYPNQYPIAPNYYIGSTF